MPIFLVLVNPNYKNDIVEHKDFNKFKRCVLQYQTEMKELDDKGSFIYIGDVTDGGDVRDGIFLNDEQCEALKKWCKPGKILHTFCTALYLHYLVTFFISLNCCMLYNWNTLCNIPLLIQLSLLNINI